MMSALLKHPPGVAAYTDNMFLGVATYFVACSANIVELGIASQGNCCRRHDTLFPTYNSNACGGSAATVLTA